MPQLSLPSPAPLSADWSTTGRPAEIGSRPQGEPSRAAVISFAGLVKWSTGVVGGCGVPPGVGGVCGDLNLPLRSSTVNEPTDSGSAQTSRSWQLACSGSPSQPAS